MPKPLCSTLIGCGLFAEHHLSACEQVPDLSLETVCDADKARAAAERFGVPASFAVVARMLETVRRDLSDTVTASQVRRPPVELEGSHCS